MTSLRRRLIFSIILGVAIMLAASSSLIYILQQREMYRAFDESLLNTANSLSLLLRFDRRGAWFDENAYRALAEGRLMRDAYFQFWVDQMPSFPNPLRQDQNRRDLQSPLLRDGNLPDLFSPPFPEDDFPGLFSSFQPDRDDADQPSNIVRSFTLHGRDLPKLPTTPGRPGFRVITLPNGAPARAVAIQHQASLPRGPRRPADTANPQPGRFTLVVAADIRPIHDHLRTLLIILIATAATAVLLSGAMAFLIVGRGLRPLRNMAHDISQLDETRLNQRLPADSLPAELHPIARQLNDLLARLDDAFERERTLTADIAHELRTPLAGIRSIAEVSLSRLRDPQHYQQALTDSLDIVRSMQSAVEKILTLARLESGQIQPVLQPVDLHARLMAVVEDHLPELQSRHIALNIDAPDRAIASADPQLADLVLSNAFINAVKYTPDSGSIDIVLTSSEAGLSVAFTNTGCELQPSDVDKVFDRFWRGDAARSETNLSCGLGLTLTRRALTAMNGSASARIADHSFILQLNFPDAPVLDSRPQ